MGYEKITCNGNEGKQEYEPNVGIKLIEKLKEQYGTGIDVILEMIIMSYNLWELYLYGHLHNFKDSGITKRGYIDEIRERIYIANSDILGFSSA